MTFDVNPAGHWYESTAGLTIHRVDVHDGIAAGAKLYHPKTGAVLSAEEDRRLSLDRESWDRNMGLNFSASGTAACSRLALERAQSHPLSPTCTAVDDGEEPPADWIEHLRPGLDTALGLDLGTTEGERATPPPSPSRSTKLPPSPIASSGAGRPKTRPSPTPASR